MPRLGGNNSTALGRNARAQGADSIAIGTDTLVTEANVVDFGSARQVRVNLTPVNDRDAVSKKYLEYTKSFQSFERTAERTVNVPSAMQRDMIILYLFAGGSTSPIYLYPKTTGETTLTQDFAVGNYMGQLKRVTINILSNSNITISGTDFGIS